MGSVRQTRRDAVRGRFWWFALAASVAATALASPSAAEAANVGRHAARATAALASVPVSFVSSIKGSGHFNFVRVQGHYAYVATGTNFIIYDVSNPASPLQASSTPVTGGFSGVWVQGSYAYLSSYNANTMSVYDVSDPANPALLATASTAAHPYDIFAVGTTAYVTNWSGNSLGIYGASNPFSPTLEGTAPASKPDYVWVQGRYAYTANRSAGKVLTDGGISIFDVSDPTHPSSVSTLQLGTPIYSVALSGTYLYATGQQNGMLYVLDVSNAASPALVTTISTKVTSSTGKIVNPGPWDIRVQGNFAYIAEAKKDWVALYDLSNPANPVQVGLAKTYAGISPQYLDVSGSYVYVADWESDALQIFKVG